MNQGDALTIAVGATMALFLASRALRASRLTFKVKAGMALVWLLLIVFATVISAWWQR